MGVPTSEVGYTPAMPRREDHEVHKRTCGGTGGEKKYLRLSCYCQVRAAGKVYLHVHHSGISTFHNLLHTIIKTTTK